MSAWFSTKLFGFRVAGYDVLRIVLGLLVLVAAGLKVLPTWNRPRGRERAIDLAAGS